MRTTDFKLITTPFAERRESVIIASAMMSPRFPNSNIPSLVQVSAVAARSPLAAMSTRSGWRSTKPAALRDVDEEETSEETSSSCTAETSTGFFVFFSFSSEVQGVESRPT